VHSLVLPVAAEALFASPAFRSLDQALRASPLAAKIAWDLLERRRGRLHATICGSLASGDTPPIIAPAQRAALAALGPIAVDVRGLFSGNVNLGRLYLPCYPERRGGGNMFHAIQRAMGKPETDLYVVGLYNLVDDLNPGEADALVRLIDRMKDRTMVELQAHELWLLSARDDLALDSDITEAIPLVAR
jgi:hypothetical protein